MHERNHVELNERPGYAHPAREMKVSMKRERDHFEYPHILNLLKSQHRQTKLWELSQLLHANAIYPSQKPIAIC